MYIMVDTDRMAFLYAHPSYEVLLDMAHIENDSAISVVPLDNAAFTRPMQSFTDLELKLLYEHTTGEKYTGYNREVLMQVVTGLALRVPPLDVKVSEVQAQAACVTEEFTGLYKFVPGSREPKLVEGGLFGVPAKQVPRCQNEEQLAVQGKLLPEPVPPGPLCAATGDDRPRANTSTPARARPAGVAPPPRGSTRETIWACADRMWEEAGKPTQPSAVLALRKKMMDQLEQDGVKRTSSSNELGNWQKVRLV